jgi:hypothetical protein
VKDGIHTAEYDLRIGVEVLNQLEGYLQNPNQTDDIVTNITIHNLQSYNPIKQYTYFLHDMLSANNGLHALPAAILWGNDGTTLNLVHDFLTVMSSGLCRAGHVISVDQLTPRTREELLHGLQRR